MFTQEMKQQLLDKIRSTEDEALLEEVYRMMEAGNEELEKVVLTNQQQERIDKGLQDIEKGRHIDHDAANEEIEAWLKK